MCSLNKIMFKELMNKTYHRTHVSSIWWVDFVQTGQLTSSKPIYLSSNCPCSMPFLGLHGVGTPPGHPFWWKNFKLSGGTRCKAQSPLRVMIFIFLSQFLFFVGEAFSFSTAILGHSRKSFIYLKLKRNWALYIFFC